MYKAITNLQKLCLRLVGAAKSHGQLIADTLASRFRGRFRGGYPDVLELLFSILVEELETLRHQAAEVEASLMASLTQDQRGRAMRNDFFSGLREQALALRKILDGFFGPGASDLVFMKKDSFVYLDPVALYRQMALVVANLLNQNFELPRPRFAVAVDLQKLAREMQPNIAGLGRVLEKLQLQHTEQSLAKKEELLAKATQRAGYAARLLEALAHYAGLSGVARRIRLSSHASTTQEDEDAAATEAQPDPAQADAPVTSEAPAEGEPPAGSTDAGPPTAAGPGTAQADAGSPAEG